MRKIIFYIFLFISVVISSQTSFDYATQENSCEEPMGFVKYNNLTLVYTFNTKYNHYNYNGSFKYRVIGFNNNGSIRFDELHNGAGLSAGPWLCKL